VPTGAIIAENGRGRRSANAGPPSSKRPTRLTAPRPLRLCHRPGPSSPEDRNGDRSSCQTGCAADSLTDRPHDPCRDRLAIWCGTRRRAPSASPSRPDVRAERVVRGDPCGGAVPRLNGRALPWMQKLTRPASEPRIITADPKRLPTSSPLPPNAATTRQGTLSAELLPLFQHRPTALNCPAVAVSPAHDRY
jgi:hypothetical protein